MTKHNIVVCSKLSIPEKDRTLPAWEYLRKIGHSVQVVAPKEPIVGTPTALISMGVTVMQETESMISRFPNIPLFCYNWDCYEWVWTNPRPKEYDYHRYGRLLGKATEIWVPSDCTGHRTTQWWGLKNWHTILSSCPYWDHEEPADYSYLLCTLREIPDPQWGWFEKACKELSIPYRMTKHECSYPDYQSAVAQCTALVSHLHELSTGGLTLTEGYYLGKPSLLCDSVWHGGRDYLGDRATYFKDGDYEDFKCKLSSIYHNTPILNLTECSSWVVENFSDKVMIDHMLERISANT